MADRRMTCSRCPRYDRAERRCLDGKANPRTKRDTRDLVAFLGVQALCHYNPYREAMAFRMYFPGRPLLHPVPKTSRSRQHPPESAPTQGLEE
ncbi:MAG: hypothetical protein RMJ43_00880 [Chloroherpetonaceae bacterium]|nr:hypothetical protein [Chthonomonadaceae bacterium]MDW8206362.1 hypothetical protein [Chloroherpetonaceae bacterium]